jgi:hypothetical protein
VDTARQLCNADFVPFFASAGGDILMEEAKRLEQEARLSSTL